MGYQILSNEQGVCSMRMGDSCLLLFSLLHADSLHHSPLHVLSQLMTWELQQDQHDFVFGFVEHRH